MIIPFGSGEAEEVPQTVKVDYYLWWWCLCALFALLAIARTLAAEILGCIFCVLMACLIWYVAKNDCKEMKQSWILLFGLISVLNFIVEMCVLATCIRGRMVRTVSETFSEDQTQRIFNITMERHPFFDSSQGFLYMMKSVVMIASPLCNLFSCILCHNTYNAFPTSLFDQEQGVLPPPGRAVGYGGYGAYGDGAAHHNLGRSQRSPFGSGQPVFSGHSERLGSA